MDIYTLGDIFSRDSFHFIVVPLLFIIVGLTVSVLSKHSKETTHPRNYLAIGTTTLLMTLGLVFGDLYSNTDENVSGEIVNWILIIIVILLSSASNDRYTSWVLDNNKNPVKKAIFMGIIFPNLVSVVVLVYYRLVIISLQNNC